MKLVFVTACLEPGRDGVGDYTRRLACECSRLSNECSILALHDGFVSRALCETQRSNGIQVPVFRIPRSLTWDSKIQLGRDWLVTRDPQWLSLQFVPFGYHKRGLCFGIGRHLKKMAPAKCNWHIMFHELWLGWDDSASLKMRIWGGMQRRIVVDLIRKLSPLAVSTHASPYRRLLEREGVIPFVSPLFGSIPIVNGDGWSEIIMPELVRAGRTTQTGARPYVAGVFGRVYPEWDAIRAIRTVSRLASANGRSLCICFFGEGGPSEEAIADMQRELNPHFGVAVALGPRSEREVSALMQSLDLGIATTPASLIEKSSSAAAMIDHGVPVLVTRVDGIKNREGHRELPPERAIWNVQEFERLAELPKRNCPRPGRAREIAGSFLQALSVRAL